MPIYKESTEAKYWRKIAEQVEKEGGVYNYDGLCHGVYTEVPKRFARLRRSMFARINLFDNGQTWFWPISASELVWNDAEVIYKTDRILAAWLCYWMCRMEKPSTKKGR